MSHSSAEAGAEGKPGYGAYFLANDRVYEQVVAFLNSFRAHNPDLPLYLIPYDDRIGRLSELREEYRFSVFSDPAVLSACDAISVRFHGTPVGHYRKLAAWEGELRRFAFFDADMLVLGSIEFLQPLLDEYAFIAASSHVPENMRWVWRDSARADGRLSEEQLAFSANTGFFASRKGALRLEELQGRLDEAASMLPHMNLACFEQPLLNFLIVTSGKPHTSLIRLVNTGRARSLPVGFWAGNRGGRVSGGAIRWDKAPSCPIFFVHWAGVWQGGRMVSALERLARLFGLAPRGPEEARLLLPYRQLWRHWRGIRSSSPSRPLRERKGP